MDIKFNSGHWPKRAPEECPGCKHYPAIILRYDGRWEFLEGDNRQWTLLSHFIDANGYDRFKGSFSLTGLVLLGIVKGAK